MRETKKSASRLRKLLACGVVAGAASFPLVSVIGSSPAGAGGYGHQDDECSIPHGHLTVTWGCHRYFLDRFFGGGSSTPVSDVAAKENIVPVVW
jgi:hypothetical protein